MVNAYALDYNGVLLDDVSQHFAAINLMLMGYGKRPVEFDPYRKGNPTDIVRFARRHGIRDATDKEIIAKFIDDYHRVVKNRPPVLRPDAIPTLDYIRDHGKQLALVSAKREAGLMRELHAYGLMGVYFKVIFADQDDKVVGLARVCEELGEKPEDVAYIGDSIHDMESGNRLRMVTIAFCNGNCDRDSLEQVFPRPRGFIDRLEELKDYV